MAMGGLTRQIIFLKDGDYGVLSATDVAIYTADGSPAQREVVTVAASPGADFKEGYSHFMEKEIHEQPDAISHTLAGMTGEDGHLTAAPLDALRSRGLDARRRHLT